MTKIEIAKKRVQEAIDQQKKILHKAMYPEFYSVDELKGVFVNPEYVKSVVGHLEKP